MDEIAIFAWIFVAVMSVVTFILYVVDKRRAMDKKWRIPEAVLLGCSLFGGAIGGYLAMKVARHKTKHWYFNVVNILFAIAHIALLIWVIV